MRRRGGSGGNPGNAAANSAARNPGASHRRAVQPPQQPATVTATEIEDPEYQGVRGVLTGIVDAYDRDDTAKIMSLLYADPVTGKQIMSELAIIFPNDMAAYRVEKRRDQAVWISGNEFKSCGSRRSPRWLWIFWHGPDRDDVSVSGDTATLTPPDDLPGNWPNKPIYFRKVGDDWKLDIEQTFRININIIRKHSEGRTETQDQLLADCGKQFTENFNAIADGIERGDIKDVYQARAGIDRMYSELFQEFSRLGVNIQPK